MTLQDCADTQAPTRILMVCLGNICRSPAAEAAMLEAAARAGIDVEVDSAGTADYHPGKPPNPPMVRVAGSSGLTVTGRARQVTPADFDRFDLVVAMDAHNLADLRRMAPGPDAEAKLRLFRDYTDAPGADVPDPYGLSDHAFIDVVIIVRDAAAGLATAITEGRA